MKLEDPPLLDLGGAIPTLSRPANAIIKKRKEKQKKPQGRKQTKEASALKYHNWLTPFLFQQIERARIVAGGPYWSTRAVVRELKKRDLETFKGLNRTTVDEWIDCSGSVPRWSDKTLERIKNGNEPGHLKGGRRGVLVSLQFALST